MMTSTLHDAEVSRRFDAAVARFKDEVPASDYRLAAVLGALAGMERPTVLDLGCGKGRFARHLERSGARVIGVDLSRQMLREGSGLARVRATARRLPFASGSFDAVVAIEAMGHLADVETALLEARRVLRPGGRLVVIDKNRLALDARRPWLPAALVKWIDERRGLWMYPPGGNVSERWFVPGRMARSLARRFGKVRVEYLLARGEARHAAFRRVPAARLMVCWTAIAEEPTP